MNSNFFINTRKNFSSNMLDNSIAIFFSGNQVKMSADSFYKFTPNRNFYYLTGISEPSPILVVSKINNTISEKMFILKANPLLEKWNGKTISSEEVTAISSIKDVSYIDDFEKYLHNLISLQDINIYLDLEVDNFDSNTLTHNQIFAKKIRKIYPNIIIKNSYPILSSLRITKSNEEVELIKKAINVTKSGFESMLKNSYAGITENLLEAHFDFELKKYNVTGIAFNSIIASGHNSTILHYENNSATTKNNDLVLCDIGSEFEHYKSDISRTFPVNGKFTDRQKELYNIVLNGQLKVIQNIKPGLTLQDLNKILIEYYLVKLKEINLIKDDSELSNYYYHSISHSLGLDTHDVGGRFLELKPGMVITVEPGLYIEEESIGIRIEDDVLITDTGCIVLSDEIIKTVEDIESFMLKNK